MRGTRGSHHSFKSRRHTLTLPKSEGDVITEIEVVLKKWGVDPSKDSEHALFATKMKKAAVDCFKANVVVDWEPLDSSEVLPSDINVALSILLEHNLKQVTKDGTKTTKRETSDLIYEKYDAFMPFPPYYFVRGELRLSRAYNEISDLADDDLDPLTRYSYKDVDIKEYMIEQFGQAPSQEYPNHFVRALVIYQAVIGGQQCLSCKREGALRWNSALRSDFCNLICGECGSVYTLCCVSNSQKVQKLFEKKCHFRGSYAHFVQLKTMVQETSHSGKMYLIFATRSHVEPETSSLLPVYVAQIKGALPNLNGDSFSLERIRIKANLLFEPMNSQRPWFSITIPKDIDILGFSMEIFRSYFGVKADSTEDQEAKAEGQARGQGDAQDRQLSNLKKVLAQINTIKEKEGRGVTLEKWELDLLGREQKVLIKLQSISAEK